MNAIPSAVLLSLPAKSAMPVFTPNSPPSAQRRMSPQNAEQMALPPSTRPNKLSPHFLLGTRQVSSSPNLYFTFPYIAMQPRKSSKSWSQCKTSHVPTHTKHLHNICTILDQRRRRWADVVQKLYKCFVFAGVSTQVLHCDHLLLSRDIATHIRHCSFNVLSMLACVARIYRGSLISLLIAVCLFVINTGVLS